MAETALRSLPSVDRVSAALDAPHAVAVAAARRAVDAVRERVRTGGGPPHSSEQLLAEAVELARAELARAAAPSLRPVLNATGVILHTNLGRAPLATSAQAQVARIAAGYSTLELELDSGRRGSRQAHVVPLLRELTGAEDALVVNNGAGAALLAVAALAERGGSVVVSRGQLVEIGGGFRIPEVIAQAGCRLIEVGTANRTRLDDYRRALEALPEPERAIVLRVHPSNFRAIGFVESVEIEPLCNLAAPVVDDLGSGALAAGMPALADEPDVRRSVRAGVALACFSGDKLLGGPQGGILVGRAAAIAAAARHPLARALRIDKLSLAALAATLQLYRDPARARREIPVLAMLEVGQEELHRRALVVADPLGKRAEVVIGTARVGGGALPLLELDGPVVAVDSGPAGSEALAARLRAEDPVVLGRIRDGRLLLDPRTLRDEDEAAEVGRRVAAAVSA